MRSLGQPAVLLRAQADIPASANLLSVVYSKDWTIARDRSAVRVEKKVKAQGWNFIRTSVSQTASGVGATRQKAIACAVGHGLQSIGAHLNVVEIMSVQVMKYPWFYLARAIVYGHRIQQGVDAVAPRKTAATSADSAPFGHSDTGVIPLPPFGATPVPFMANRRMG